MKNIIQVVEVTPSPDGQWVTFWHLGEQLRVSGEFETDAYVGVFDRGDLYVCLHLDDHLLSMVGPHPVELLRAREFADLPIIPDQESYSRHDRYRRFDLDRDTSTLSAVSLSEGLKQSLIGKTPAESLKEIADLH